MNDLSRALRTLWPTLNFSDVDGRLENVRYCDPLPDGFEPPTQDEVAVEIARASKLAAAAAAFAGQVAAGITFGGKLLQIRDTDRANITGQAARAVAALTAGSGVTWPSNFAWRMADNSYLPLPTPADMLALGEAVSDRYAALRLRFGQLKDAIAAAETVEALDALDVDAGWQ